MKHWVMATQKNLNITIVRCLNEKLLKVKVLQENDIHVTLNYDPTCLYQGETKRIKVIYNFI